MAANNSDAQLLHCALSLAAQCIVTVPVCLSVCLWVCYHDNSKLRTLIFTKLGTLVKVVTISSWINFGCPAPQGRGLRRGENFSSALLQPARCMRLSTERFYH